MSRPKPSIAPLHVPLLVLLVTLACAALLDYATSRFLTDMEDSQSRLEHDVSETRIRKLQIRNREASFRADADAFRQLELRGIRGPEQRLAWVAITEALAREFRLSRSDYQLAAQRPFAQIATDEGKVVRLNASRVAVSLDAAHEGRLLGFLQGLDARVPGLLLARQCQFDSSGGDTPLVHANCSLDWVTMDAAGLPAMPGLRADSPDRKAGLVDIGTARPISDSGRLFTTAAQRHRIDAGGLPANASAVGRPLTAIAPRALPPDQQSALSGFVLRSGGRNTYWLDDSGSPHSSPVTGR